MNYIYTHKENGHKYILIPELTMGTKVCIRDMGSNKDKFVQPATLKKNYSKRELDSEIVEVKAFTGMFIGLFELTPVADHWMVTTKAKKVLEFDSDGNQVNSKNPKFGNRIDPKYTYGWQKSTLDWALN